MAEIFNPDALEQTPANPDQPKLEAKDVKFQSIEQQNRLKFDLFLADIRQKAESSNEYLQIIAKFFLVVRIPAFLKRVSFSDPKFDSELNFLKDAAPQRKHKNIFNTGFNQELKNINPQKVDYYYMASQTGRACVNNIKEQLELYRPSTKSNPEMARIEKELAALEVSLANTELSAKKHIQIALDLVSLDKSITTRLGKA